VLNVMDAIEARLSTISGLRVSDVSPGQVNPPQAIIGTPNVEYHAVHSGGDEHDFQLYVLTSAALDRIGQRLLAEFAASSGARSIRATLEADRSLGGVADDVRVTRFRVLGRREVGLIGYFGGVFTVEVLAEWDVT